MKDFVSVKKIPLLDGIADRLGAVAMQFWSVLLGFAMSRTTLWGGIAPLGAAYVSGLPMKYMFSGALGALLGYIFPPMTVSTFKYAAALLGVTAIRFIVSGIKPAAKNPIWSAVISATVVAGVGVAAAGQAFLTKGVLGISEGLLAGGSAYFIRRATAVKWNKTAGLTPEQTASSLIAVSLALTSVMQIELVSFSLGKILGVVLILFAARYGRAGAACISSAAISFSALVSGSDSQTVAVICFAGLASGAISSLGKIVTAVSPAAVAAVWVLVSSASSPSVSLLVESAVAGVIFFFVPRTVSARIGGLLNPKVITPDTAGLRKTLTMRLGFASAALKGVSETVEDVSRCLALSKKPNFANVLHEVENDACRGCTFMLYCWEKNRKTTIDAILGLCEAIRTCRPLNLADVPDAFCEKCLRLERFEASLSRHYTDYLSAVSAEKRVAEMRGVMSDQMTGIADMLLELSEEFRTAQRYDIAMANRVAASLKEIDIRADECSCVVDKFGRITVEIKLCEAPEMPLNRAKILDRIEETCEREFEPPEVTRSGRVYYITASEKAVFSVDCHCTQFNQGKNKLCGDTCRHFFDGRGRLIIILSDGMGSGGRAAVDSGLTSGLAERLLKAGFGYDCTLKLVNSAMLFKSSDESLATVDISCIDLFSGKTELLKAGAAPTLVRRNGRTGRAECKTLPAGILNEVGFDKATVSLKEDDILVMVSDGVTTDGTDWICAELEAWRGGGAKQLSERIATAARRRRRDGHDDDITVFAAILEKAM